MTPQSKWRKSNPDKVKAHWKVQNALKFGKLIKEVCVVCGCIDVQAHHKDYTKPLEVVWLCAKHHSEEHPKEKKIKIKVIKTPRLETHLKFQPLKPNDLIPKAKELRDKGLSYGQISKELGYSRSQVYKWVNDLHN